MIDTLKVCTKCGLEKSIDDFHVRRRSHDGRMAQCKDCVNARIRANYASDPQKKIAKTRRYHLDHPEWSKETLREWHAAHREERAAKVRERLATDPEFKEYRREIVARKERERRAQKANTEIVKLTTQDYADLLEQYGNICWVCEIDLPRPHWDHVHPLAKGGAHSKDNLRPICNACNTRKSANWPFTEEMRARIAEEVRALRTPQGHTIPDRDGLEVN